MVCISSACANNLVLVVFIGGTSYPGDLAGWLLHALSPKQDKELQIYFTHHLQTLLPRFCYHHLGLEVCTNEVFSD